MSVELKEAFKQYLKFVEKSIQCSSAKISYLFEEINKLEQQKNNLLDCCVAASLVKFDDNHQTYTIIDKPAFDIYSKTFNDEINNKIEQLCSEIEHETKKLEEFKQVKEIYERKLENPRYPYFTKKTNNKKSTEKTK